MFNRPAPAIALFSAALLAANSQNATAADADGSFTVLGAGLVTCQMYVDATPEQRLHAETWWGGYATAMNRVTADTFNLLGDRDYSDVNAWLEAWCREHPEALYVNAVHEMLESFYPDRTRSAP